MKPFRGKFPMKVGVPMTEEMVAFLDTHSMEMSNLLEAKTTRADLVRECIARIAYEHFDQDIE